MKALIFENKVIDTATTEFEVHESMTWMDCSDDCEAGEWEVVSGSLQAIVVTPLTHAQAYARSRKQEYDKLNQFEMQFDDQRDGTTTWVDSINEIKSQFPKG